MQEGCTHPVYHRPVHRRSQCSATLAPASARRGGCSPAHHLRGLVVGHCSAPQLPPWQLRRPSPTQSSINLASSLLTPTSRAESQSANTPYAPYLVPRPRKLNLESTGQWKGAQTPSSSAFLCLRHHRCSNLRSVYGAILRYQCTKQVYTPLQSVCHLYVYINLKLYIGGNVKQHAWVDLVSRSQTTFARRGRVWYNAYARLVQNRPELEDQ